MRAYRLRQVKREIRVLGIAVGRAEGGEGLHVVGVVFRGGLWLDGVMRTKAEGPDVTGEAVEMIAASPHHPQIRVVLLDRDLIGGGATIRPCGLSSGVSRPVIAINFDRADCPAGDEAVHGITIEKRGAPTQVLIVGLSSRVALRVLRTASREEATPEALRVAELAVSALTEAGHHNL